jgi:hypothetical protein
MQFAREGWKQNKAETREGWETRETLVSRQLATPFSLRRR